MKTKKILKENTTRSFISRMLYAFQVIIIAIAIPVLSYLEMTHVEKPESPSTENSSIKMEKANAIAITLK